MDFTITRNCSSTSSIRRRWTAFFTAPMVPGASNLTYLRKYNLRDNACTHQGGNMTMHRLALAAAVAVLFAGCATQGTDDQAANAQPASRAAQAPAPAPAPQSSLRAGSGVRDAKTMPNASSVYYQYDQ